jgi:hypothetical protein
MTVITELAWGAKVAPEFREKAIAISGSLRVDPSDLMACMAFESGETFSPNIRNAAGSGAVGLIQFMPATARGLGTTSAALAAMSAVQQLDYVRAYFKPYIGKLRTLSDLYMAILWPRGVGKPDSCVLWDRSSAPTTFRQNSGLDANRDGAITKGEAAAKVRAKLVKGLQPGYVWRAS